MTRVTSKQLDATFAAFVQAATDCGIDTDNWLLTHGSKTYGNAYGVYKLLLPGYGHGDVYRFSHIGMTASEADRYLRAATGALWLVMDAQKEPTVDQLAFDHDEQRFGPQENEEL